MFLRNEETQYGAVHRQTQPVYRVHDGVTLVSVMARFFPTPHGFNEHQIYIAFYCIRLNKNRHISVGLQSQTDQNPSRLIVPLKLNHGAIKLLLRWYRAPLLFKKKKIFIYFTMSSTNLLLFSDQIQASSQHKRQTCWQVHPDRRGAMFWLK